MLNGGGPTKTAFVPSVEPSSMDTIGSYRGRHGAAILEPSPP